MTATWRDYPRTKDKVAIVGFADSNKLTPWEDDSYEFWSLNEEYRFEWFKRTPDRHFQLHPRWDFTRTNNGNHFNHPNWLFNTSGVCMKCNGTLEWKLNDEVKKCDECTDGTYTPPSWRLEIPVYMQEHWDDIPNSIAYPLAEATAVLPLGYPYFTSSLALILTLAFMMGFKRVELYGFEMGTMTEYHYQRANGEYLIGFFQGKGMDIWIPESSPLLKGELYGYKNMKTGFRQNLEMRKQILEGQEQEQLKKVNIMTGQVIELQALSQNPDFAAVAPKLAQRMAAVNTEYMKVIGLHNVIKGAQAEADTLTKLYDEYFIAGTERGKVLSAEEVQAFTNAKYE